MARSKSRIIQAVEYAGVMLAAWPLSRLPYQVALRIGERVGDGLYRLLKQRRTIALHNLDIAFGDTLSFEEKDRIVRAIFRNLGKSIAEVIHFPGLSDDFFRQKTEIVGIDHYLNARRKGRGVLYVSGHFGNWEMMGQMLSAAGYPLHVVVRPLDNPYLNRIVERLRTLHGNTLIARGGGLKQMIAALRKHEDVGVFMDQNTLRSRGIFVDFFGKPACTVPVVALLALRFNVPVIPAFIVRTGFDTHRLVLGEDIDILRSGDIDKDVARNTARFNTLLADIIRQHPDQWLWIHRRWKTQPEPE